MTDDEQFLADLHAIADRAHASEPEADAAPPNTWQHVLATAKSETESTIERRPSMNAHIAQPMSPVWQQPASGGHQTRSFSGTIRRYANLAATITLVLAVAVGGWLTMMQLQPNDPDPRFAVLPATPEGVAQTCDVEPLSVDESMQVVQNPYMFLADYAEETTGTSILRSPDESDLIEATLVPDRYQYETAGTIVPPQATFDDARQTVDTFLNCLPYASFGQLWAMLDPLWVQQLILGRFPVFVAEEDVLRFVQENIDQPLSSSGNPLDTFYRSDQPFTITANPNRESTHVALTFSSGYNSIVAIGSQVVGADGEVMLETDSTGFPQILRANASQQRPVLVVGKSAVTGEWYILPWLGDKSIIV